MRSPNVARSFHRRPFGTASAWARKTRACSAARYGGGTITVRLHANDQDAARGFNRTENVRPIPPTDVDFPPLYARRNDAESINRGVDDSMYLRRAHSFGHARQHVNLLGYALLVNSIALLEHHRRMPEPLPAAA